MIDTIINKITEAPKTPGCYIFIDKDSNRIYVGKAKNIRNRTKSYIKNFLKLDVQKQMMITDANDIEFYEVDDEVEALILENNLIKKYRPKYNIMLKDDKSYIYVRFEKVRKSTQSIPKKDSVYQDFPRITTTREKKDDKAEYFGPYPNAFPVKNILRKLQRIFQFRTGNEHVYVDKKGKVVSNTKKPSLFYHIGLSKGAEAGLESKADYVKRFNQVKQFFRGEKKMIIKELEDELKIRVKNLDFEEAARLRDKIRDIKYVTSNIRLDNSVDDVVISELKKKQREGAIIDLVEELGFPQDKIKNHEGFKIECYDISNIQGTNAVGSMVVMVDGQIRPDLYRKFRIRMKNEPNDFAMLQEMLTRRFKQYLFSVDETRDLSPLSTDYDLPRDLEKRAKNWKSDVSFSNLPDLIIIDGGKGQLASCYKILYQFGLHNDVPMIGLAKREEEIYKLHNQFNDNYSGVSYVNDSSMFKKIKLSKRSDALQLIQRIRDEAHRFAITYHRKLRSKALISSNELRIKK